MKTEPLPGLEFDRQAAAVHLDDAARNGEPQPGAAFDLGDRIVGLLKFLEQLVLIGRGDPGPVSWTATLNEPLAGATLIVTPPASVNLIALPTRLSSTWVSLRSSPWPAGMSGGTLDLELEVLLRRQRLDRAVHVVRRFSSSSTRRSRA